MSKSSFFSSTIGKKFWMSVAGLFLASFVLLHFALNFIAIFSADLYNVASEFMGRNWIIQFVMQPLLVFALVFHFSMGIYLERKNKAARPVKYAMNNPKANSSWISRNMALTGIIILAFLIAHMIDFFFPEMDYKYVTVVSPDDPERYYAHLMEAFSNPLRVGAYIIGFIALGFHLMHGVFASMQSIGQNNQYSRAFTKLGRILTVVVCTGFTITAIALYIQTLN